ncbi:MAG: histidine phosphatase family protein [Candidatus Micrarchaeota archaeon]|nr:histidine phosphatase family protein [Candidatus Micrarchaeota archaeon]
MKKSKTEIVVIRHAQAEGNKEHIFNGNKIDAALTAEGKRQAKELLKIFKQKPDVILSSPLKRALETASYFEKKYKIKIIVWKELQEQDFGLWTGKSATKIKKLYPKYFIPHLNGELSNFVYYAKGGESYKQLKQRVKKVLNRIKKEYKKKRVFVFCHGVVALAMMELVTKIKPPKLLNLQLKNADWVHFIFD